jgi:GTPase Era involved in 16S rRNA processing
LKFLQEPGNLKEPRIAVFGKFNHGKSTLLNTLTGEDIFKVADIRETTKISEHLHNGIIWVDIPSAIENSVFIF